MDWQGNLSGYLYKRGKGESFFGRRSWKKRFFTIEDQKLKYWENEFTAKNRWDPFGVLLLNKSSVVEPVTNDENKPFSIKLTTSNRVLLISASSEAERAQWMKAIEFHIRSSSNGLLL